MRVDFACCLVSLATVTQQSHHLINLILSDSVQSVLYFCEKGKRSEVIRTRYTGNVKLNTERQR